jgi:hypothetical protein
MHKHLQKFMKLGGRATYVHLDSSKKLGEQTPHGAGVSFIRPPLVVRSTCEVTPTLPSFNMIGSSVYHSHMEARGLPSYSILVGADNFLHFSLGNRIFYGFICFFSHLG